AGLVGDGLLVDGGDDQALAQVDLIGEGARTNAGDEDSLADAGSGGDVRRNRRDGDAEGGLAYIGLLRAGLIFIAAAGEVGVGLGPVADHDVGDVLLAVADVAEFD